MASQFLICLFIIQIQKQQYLYKYPILGLPIVMDLYLSGHQLHPTGHHTHLSGCIRTL